MEVSRDNNLSPIKKMALKVIDFIRERIINDECSDEELSDSMNKLHFDTNKEYVRASDYVNADEAMRILHLGYNRNKLFQLTKKYGIINHKINNVNIGFKRKEIENLSSIIK